VSVVYHDKYLVRYIISCIPVDRHAFYRPVPEFFLKRCMFGWFYLSECDSSNTSLRETDVIHLPLNLCCFLLFTELAFSVRIHSGSSVEYMNNHCIWNKWVRNYRRMLPSHLTHCQIKLALAMKILYTIWVALFPLFITIYSMLFFKRYKYL